MNENKDKNREEHVIETASATSSPESNKNSGPFAYIITAVAIVVLLLGTLGMGACTAAIVSAAIDDGVTSPSGGFSVPQNRFDDMENFENFDIDEFLRQYEYDMDNGSTGSSSSSSQQHSKSSVSVADALDFDLAPYSINLDQQVSASAYAGVPNDVREFVRNVVSTDKQQNDEVVKMLYDAALDEKTQSQKIGEAIAKCDEAKKAIDAIEVPAIENDKDEAVKNALDTAKAEASKRWDALREELNVLNTSESISTRRLWEADDTVVQSTEKAGELLVTAMEQSTNK